MPRKIAFAIALPVAAASLVSCSGSRQRKATHASSPAARPRPAPAAVTDPVRAACIAQGDALSRQMQEVPDPVPSPVDDSNGAIATWFKGQLDATRPKVEAFAALEPPRTAGRRRTR